MGMPVKLSDELVESARQEATTTDRSLTGQIEHWARIGRSVETVLGHKEVQALKTSPLSASLSPVSQRVIKAALERAVAETDRAALARSLTTGRTVYQSDPAGSGLTQRIEADGTRTLGQFKNRRFVPARPVRTGRR